MRVAREVAWLSLILLVAASLVTVAPAVAVPGAASPTSFRASAAAPPTLSGCTPTANGRPRIVQDQTGSYLQVRLRYRCATRKYYNIFGTVYRVQDSSGGPGFFSDVQEGTSATPLFYTGVGRCKTSDATRYRVAYDIKIGSSAAPVYYQTPAVQLPCRR